MLIGKRMVAFLGTAVIGGVLAVGTLVAQTTPVAQTQTMEGTLTDAMCGMKHKGANAASCMKGCVTNGSAYAIVVGDKVYELSGKGDELAKLGPVKVKVTGKVDGMKIAVDSVAAVS